MFQPYRNRSNWFLHKGILVVRKLKKTLRNLQQKHFLLKMFCRIPATNRFFIDLIGFLTWKNFAEIASKNYILYNIKNLDTMKKRNKIYYF